MAKNPRLKNPYYKQDGDLSLMHFKDKEIFEELDDEMKVSHLEAGIWEYGEDSLDDNMKATAVELGVLTTPSPSFDTDNSLLTAAANVLSHIPKWLIFILTASEALKTVCAFPKYNPILDNSGAVDHGSAGNAKIMYNVKYHLLGNKNCVAFGIAPIWTNSIINREIYGECFNGPCPDQTSIPTKGAKYLGLALGLASEMKIKRIGNDQAELEFQHLTQNVNKYDTVKHTCNLPLSPGNEHLEQSINLLSNHNYTGALDEVDKALSIDPNFESALAYRKIILQLLPSTTIKPSSSTSLIEGNSTTTEKTTTPVEANNAPFKGIATPTTTQNSTNQGGSLKDTAITVLSVISAVATIGGIVILFYKKGSAIYHK